jgi:hypothetical protein
VSQDEMEVDRIHRPTLGRRKGIDSADFGNI